MRGGEKARLLDTLKYYFKDEYKSQYAERLTVIGGDVTKPFFGMDDISYISAAKETGIIIHCAADVRHFAADDGSLDTNVEGVRRVIAFASLSEAMLCHISTLSVAGDNFIKGIQDKKREFTERDFYIGQNYNENIYVRGKFLAEAEVIKACEAGIPAKIFRIGRLVGRAKDGVFQKNPEANTFYHLINSLRAIKAVPVSLKDILIDLTPVDICVEAIRMLIDAPYRVAHIFEDNPLTFEELAQVIVPEAELLDNSDFTARLMKASGVSRDISVELWNKYLLYPPEINPDSRLTHKRLRSLGYRWDTVSPEITLSSFI